jgi:hypothetical protein
MAISATLLVAGGVGAFGEIAPYVALHGTDTEQIAVLRSAHIHPGLSLGSKTVVLRECAALVQSPVTRVQRAAEREEVLEACHSLAASMTAQMPTYSEAWLVRALASLERSDFDSFNAELGSSRALAASVNWLAAERVRLSETYFDRLDEPNHAGHLRDLLALTESQAGLLALAENYVGRPLARDRIASVVETAQPAAQAEFLSMVQSLSGAADGD